MTNRLTDKEQWELLIPEMGYMALLRNLRNFDQAPISQSVATQLGNRLSDPDQVAKSKQLPFRFYSAWLNSGPQWQGALEKAMDASLPNIPQLEGKSLILIDTSGSMGGAVGSMAQYRQRMSRRVGRGFNASTGQVQDYSAKTPRMCDVAGLFGIALAKRNVGNVDVVEFASTHRNITKQVASSSGSLLRDLTQFSNNIGGCGGGTEIEGAIRSGYNGHDRVFIFTDMQTMPAEDMPMYRNNYDVTRAVPKDKHVYGFDLSGYTESGMASSDYRHEMGGLTDATLGTIQAIEAGTGGVWPW